MIIKLEKEELIYIPETEEFRVLLRNRDNTKDLIIVTPNSDYVIVSGLGEGATDDFAEVIQELYVNRFFQKIEESLSSEKVTAINILSVYDDVLDYLNSLVKKEE